MTRPCAESPASSFLLESISNPYLDDRLTSNMKRLASRSTAQLI